MKGKLLLFVSLLSLAGFAQQPLTQRPSNLQNVIPPSPNASSLGKYADFPVSLYTGIPEVDIPLYTLKGRSISVPISVSYHASGIRVGEVASSVGLGWALNGGGVITRSVRGLPDEAGGSGYTTIKSYYNNPGDLSSGTPTGAAVPDSINIVNASAGLSDSEPDLYMFNALGRSFKFYFAGNNVVITQPSSGVIIKTHFQDNTWLATMEDGTKLVFGGTGAVEVTSSTRAVVEASAPTFISAWYLKTMTSPTGEVITFMYESSTINQDATFYQSDYRLLFSQKSGCATTNPVKPAYRYFESQSVSMLNLQSIESELGKIIFRNDTTGRIDLTGGKYLKEIDVYAKPTSKLIKSFTFTRSYSTATTGNSYTTTNSTQAKYRMKLISIQEVPTDNSSPKVWRFGYNPLTLPSRQSYAQDYWGYYNGVTTNTTLLPSVPGFDNPAKYTSGNRSADSVSMSAEMLTKITYPTGGFTKFNYEPNSIPATKDFQNSQAANINMYLTANQNPYNNTLTQILTTTQPQYTYLTINASFSSSITNDYGPTVVIAKVSILNSSQTTVANFNISGNKLSNGHYNVAQNLYLRLGDTYTFKVSSISQSSDFVTSSDYVSIQAALTYTGSLGVHAYNQPVGGVRIKTMIDSSGNSTPIQRNFKYENANVVPFDPVNDFVSLAIDNTYDDNGSCSTVHSGSSSTSSTAADSTQQDTNYPPTPQYQFPGSFNVGFPTSGSSGSTCVNYTATDYNFDDSTSGSSTFSCQSQTSVKPPTKTTDYYVSNTFIDHARGGPSSLTDTVESQDEITAQGDATGTLISSYQYAARNSSVKCALGSIQGGTVGYGKITVTYGPNGGNGYTISYFTQATDLNVPSSKSLPYPPVVPLDWQKGLLTSEITYNNSNVPVKRIYNNYAFVNQQSIKTFKAAPLFNTASTHYPTNLLGSFINKLYYQIITQQVQKTSSGNVNYYNNGADSVVTTTNYFYDNATDYQPERTETTNSRGENLKMLSRTALEKADINTSITLSSTASAAIDTMVARNMIGHPIEVETYNNNVLVSKALTNYALFSNNVLPQEIKTVEGANTIQSRVLFNNYNIKGDLLEQQKTAGQLNDYIWDYAANNVIAAVINGSRTNIAYTSFEADSTGNWTVPTASRDTLTAAITGYKSYVLAGNSISKSGLNASTTYVVSYWTRNTSAYTITGTVSGYPVKGVTVNGWTYYEHLVIGQSTISVTGSGNIDELRLYPVGTLMTTYTYSPQVGVTSMTDAKGQTVYYEYDVFQRLMNVRDMNGNILKHSDYHYQGQ